MARQKSGEMMMASPTPSIDSLNSAAVGSLCGLEQVTEIDYLATWVSSYLATWLPSNLAT